MFTIGSDGQIRTVVGVDYRPRTSIRGLLRVRGTDLDTGKYATLGVVLYVVDSADGDYR